MFAMWLGASLKRAMCWSIYLVLDTNVTKRLQSVHTFFVLYSLVPVVGCVDVLCFY